MNSGLSGMTPGHRAREILSLEKDKPGQAEARWQELEPEERLRTVLAARGKDRERLIILARFSRELLQGLPADEFTRTVLEVGPGDAATLLELSSPEQLTYLLDLTGWSQERFAPRRYETWVPVILEAGSIRLSGWLAETDLEVLSLLFAHWFQVVKWVASSDEQEPPGGLPEFTLDGVYFINFHDQTNAGFVAQVLVQLKSDDPGRYATVLESMLWESAALLAEEALRWRNGRLADHGFPDRLEALELWARPAPGEVDWEHRTPKAELGFLSGAPPRSDAHVGMLPPEETLPILAGSLEGPAADVLRAELAYIANCGVVAAGVDPASPALVEQAGKEGLGLVNLGLDLLSGGDRACAAEVLSRMGMPALARQGAQILRQLNRRSFLLLNQGWLKGLPGGLHFLDEPLDRWLAGLIFPRPRCYDPGLSGNKDYRAFYNLGDVDAARRNLAKAEFWGVLLFEFMAWDKEELLALFDAALWPQEAAEIKLSAVVSSWLARRGLGLPGLAPVPVDRLKEALAYLQEGLQERLPAELNQSCCVLADPVEQAMAGELLRHTLQILEHELGGINLEMELDPNFVGGLVLS